MNQKKNNDLKNSDLTTFVMWGTFFCSAALALTFNAGVSYGMKEAKKEILPPQKEVIPSQNQSLFVADSIQTKIKPV